MEKSWSALFKETIRLYGAYLVAKSVPANEQVAKHITFGLLLWDIALDGVIRSSSQVMMDVREYRASLRTFKCNPNITGP